MATFRLTVPFRLKAEATLYAPLHGRAYLRDGDRTHAPARPVATPLVVTGARVEARHRDVGIGKRTVARGIGGSKQTHGWRADGGGNMKRTGVP